VWPHVQECGPLLVKSNTPDCPVPKPIVFFATRDACRKKNNGLRYRTVRIFTTSPPRSSIKQPAGGTGVVPACESMMSDRSDPRTLSHIENNGTDTRSSRELGPQNSEGPAVGKSILQLKFPFCSITPHLSSEDENNVPPFWQDN